MLWAQPVWKGTEAESHALLGAIARNCVCEFADTGALVRACPAHHALVHSQRFLDGLLFGRRIARRFVSEEWALEWTPQAARNARSRRVVRGS
jgi:hypothetical protein